MSEWAARLCAVYWLLCLLCLATGIQAGLECHFPDFVQSDGGRDGDKRDWRTHMSEGSRHSNHSWELALGFYGDNMRSSVIGGMQAEDRPHPFTRHCIIEVIGGRYLVNHVDHGTGPAGAKPKYMCIEFTQHGDDVVQISHSHMTALNNPRLCSDEFMKKDPWIVINRANFYRSKVECPLTGGYNMRIYDKMRDIDVCSAYDGETRLESECMMGEGMYFRFRHENCIPQKLHMHKQQRIYCMANWQVGTYTYSILRKDKSEHAWCFKFPTDNNGAFLAYLFRDVRCEYELEPSDNNRYLRLGMVRDAPRSLSDLCVDDYEACQYWKSPCIHAGSALQLTCAKRCGICDADTPSTCTVPGALKGKWSEQHAQGINHLELGDMHFNVEGYPSFTCIQWSPRPYEHDVHNYEQMFVSTFDNGCRPRYTCAQFKKHSPSVLKYKLSQSEIWPWEKTTGVSVNCDQFTYKKDDEPLGSRYHSRHLKVLITGVNEHVYVDCQLPHDVMHFHVVHRDGPECDGRLIQVQQSHLQMELDGCSFNLSQVELERQNFGCLDSSKHGYLSNRIIVTEVLDGGSSKVVCWMFPIHPRDTFYLLPAEECNEGARERISTAVLQPLASFTVFMPSTSTSTTGKPLVEVDSIVSMGQSHKQLNPGVQTGDRADGSKEGYRVQTLDGSPDQGRSSRDQGKAVNSEGGDNSGPSSSASTIVPLSASICVLLFLVTSSAATTSLLS